MLTFWEREWACVIAFCCTLRRFVKLANSNFSNSPKTRTKEAGFFDSHVTGLLSKVVLQIETKVMQRYIKAGVNDFSAHLGGEMLTGFSNSRSWATC